MNKTLPFVLALSVFAVPAFAQPQSNIDPVPGIKAVVNDFVKALNGRNLYMDAAPDVAEIKDYGFEGGAKWGEAWTDRMGKLALNLEKIEVSDLTADSATAHVSYHWSNYDPRFRSETIVEDLAVQLSAGQKAKWQILPTPSVPTPNVAPAENLPVLNDVAANVADPKNAWGKEQRRAASTSLKMLGLAAFEFMQKNDFKLAVTADSYADSLKPFLLDMTKSEPESAAALQSPVSGARFSFNSELAGYQFPKGGPAADISKIVLFYEGQDEKLDYLYQGGTEVLFLDGHVGYITPEKAVNLIWKP